MHSDPTHQNDPVRVENATGTSRIVLVCEHASNMIPSEFNGLGLDPVARDSHAAWDPGALAVAQGMAQRLDAVLVAGGVSRLVYDCNRPPEAADAMPARSEVFDIPGNQALSAAEKAARVEAYYLPFRTRLASVLARAPSPILVTIHSFTPVYHGRPRAVEVGVLHDKDTRLADAMLATTQAIMPAHRKVARNEPYGAEHGVTHTLKEHGLEHGRLNVMLEIRNDLIATPQTQAAMAEDLAQWLTKACAHIGESEGVACQA